MDDKPARTARKGHPDRGPKRPARRPEKPKSNLVLILALLGVFGVVGLVGAGVGAYLMFGGKKETSVASASTSQSNAAPTGMPNLGDPDKTPPSSTPTAPLPNGPGSMPNLTSPPTGPSVGPPSGLPKSGMPGLPGASGSGMPGLNNPNPSIPNPGLNPTIPNPNPAPSAPPPPAFKPRPAPPPKAPIAKIAMPGTEELTRAETALKDTYKEDYKKTTQPAEKLALAAKLLQPGREDRKDPAAWFVLLREARDLAVQAGRPRLAVEAINEMDRYFTVNALDMKIKALADTSKSGKDLDVATAYRVGLTLIQQSYDAENFDAAKRVIDLVEQTVRDAKAADLLKLVQAQRLEIEAYTKEFQAVAQARSKLATAANDPDANLAAGKYLCFFQGDWGHGLPLLAKGGDAALKDLAMKDLAKPEDVKGQMAVADAWWNWGGVQRDREQRHVARHARSWYEKAGPASQGGDRIAIINRIQAAQKKEYERIRRLQPGSYYGRDIENRTLLLREGGGTMKSEEAIERGLEWLAKHQVKDGPNKGMWSMDAFKKGHPGCNCGEHGEKHDVAGTALAMLPFLGAGNTHKSGPYQQVVLHGLEYLLKQRKATGNFHDNAYENALATIVVVELFGLTKDRALQFSAQGAVSYIVRAQFTDGSWGYSAGSKGDTSVAGWQFTALKAAAYAKLEVPSETFDRLSRFLDAVAASDGTGYGYNTPANGPATSAVGILCREFLSWGPGHPGLIKEIDFLLRPETFPTKEKISIYSVFYITQVAHHFGSFYWDEWNERVRDVLVELQDKGEKPKEHQKGSWTPPEGEPHAKAGGRLMYTALALVTLETYYYHIPLYAYGPYTLMD